MSSDSQDSLDQLLGDWAASRAADEEHMRRLANQILSAARDEAPPLSDQPMPAAYYREAMPSADWGGKLMIGGFALLLVLVIGGSMLYYNLTKTPIDTQHPTPSIASSTGSEPVTSSPAEKYPLAASLGANVLAAKRELLSETNAVFDNQLAWIADGQREVSLEVRDHAASDVGDFMLVRVVVAQRTSAELPWSTVWQTDVISRNEALVEVSAEQLDGASLALWTHLMSGGEVAVDMDLVLGQQSRLQSSSAVLQAGQPTRVGCSIEDGVEQCVFQTVMPLHPSQI